VLAEAFDADPFAMLAWRGKGRDDLLTALRGSSVPAAPSSGGTGLSGNTGRGAVAPGLASVADVTAAPLAESLADFWSPRLSQARLRALPPSPATPPDLLLRISEPPPIQIRGASLSDLLAPAYARLADSGADEASEL
jgi:uncharacterized Zn finger protein